MKESWNLVEDAAPQPVSHGAQVHESAEPRGGVICFGPYRLDRASGCLLRGGTSVPLRCKTFAVLEYLATRPGRLVAKNELLDAVWPDTHVTPSVLAGCIRELRRALRDDARAARFVETAHRRGYRFVAASIIPAAPVASVARVPLFTRDNEIAALARRFAAAVARVIARGRRAAAGRRYARHKRGRRKPRAAAALANHLVHEGGDTHGKGK